MKKSSIVSAILIVAFLTGLFVFSALSQQEVRLPVEVTRSALPRAVEPPSSLLHGTEAPLPTSEVKEVKIFVVATGIPSYWSVKDSMADWNLADHYADFVPVTSCPVAEPCLTVQTGKLGNTTAAQTQYQSNYNQIILTLNNSMQVMHNPFAAHSTMCHELGHVLGMPHISGTVDTCMTAVNGFYRTKPSKLDSRLVNSYGTWEFGKMYELSGKDVDVRGLPR